MLSQRRCSIVESTVRVDVLPTIKRSSLQASTSIPSQLASHVRRTVKLCFAIPFAASRRPIFLLNCQSALFTTGCLWRQTLPNKFCPHFHGDNSEIAARDFFREALKNAQVPMYSLTIDYFISTPFDAIEQGRYLGCTACLLSSNQRPVIRGEMA
jgi:hypothetical protein